MKNTPYQVEIFCLPCHGCVHYVGISREAAGVGRVCLSFAILFQRKLANPRYSWHMAGSAPHTLTRYTALHH